MSPEQAGGWPVTPASDVFGLGAVIAFAATGRSPFGDGTAPAVLYRIVHGSPDLDGLATDLRALAAACLDRNPDNRPSPDDILGWPFAADPVKEPETPVTPPVAERTVVAVKPSPTKELRLATPRLVTRKDRPRRQTRLLTVVACVVFLVLCAGVAWYRITLMTTNPTTHPTDGPRACRRAVGRPGWCPVGVQPGRAPPGHRRCREQRQGVGRRHVRGDARDRRPSRSCRVGETGVRHQRRPNPGGHPDARGRRESVGRRDTPGHRLVRRGRRLLSRHGTEPVAFSGDGRFLVKAGTSIALSALSAREASERRSYEFSGKVGKDSLPATSVAMSTNGHLVAVADDSGHLELWDVTEMLPS